MAEMKPMTLGVKIAIGCGICVVGFVGLIVFIIAVAVFSYHTIDNTQQVTASQSQNTSQVSAQEGRLYQIGESFKLGYFRYTVKGIQWRTKDPMGTQADSRFIVIKMQVKNEDKQSRMIEDFKLEDENGSTYEDSPSQIWFQGGNFLKSLNPGVTTNIVLVYDVPPKHHYNLLLTGGYWSTDSIKVKLN